MATTRKRRTSAPTKQDEIARTRRRQKVLSLYLRRLTQDEIATELDVAIGTVNSDIKIVQKQLQKKTIKDAKKALERDLDELDEMEREAWTQYHHALDRRRVLWSHYLGKDLQEGMDADDLDPNVLTALFKSRSWKEADPGVWQDRILNIKKRRAALLGMDSETVRLVGDRDNPVFLAWASDEELEKARRQMGGDDGEEAERAGRSG